MELSSFYPAIVTALIIAPLGVYIQSRMKSFATKRDFDGAIDQLNKSTKTVENIKNQLSEKYWVKQQIWDTKRSAYEEILNCLFLTKSYINKEIEYSTEFFEVHVVMTSGIISNDEEYMNSYNEHVDNEQNQFREKYESDTAIKQRKELTNNTHVSYEKLEAIFNVKSIYLNPEIMNVENLLLDLKNKLFNEKFDQRDDEDLEAFLERDIDHHTRCNSLVDEIISKTKDLASIDLLLT